MTGSSGAGTTTTSVAFRKIFQQLNIRAAELEGDSFHRYTGRKWTGDPQGARSGQTHQLFRPRGQRLKPAAAKLYRLRQERYRALAQVSAHLRRSGARQSGAGYLHPWEPLPAPTDVLFYEGLHGGVVNDHHDVANVDLLVGVVPIVNPEWIQKLIRDTGERGHSRSGDGSVVRSMEDYINTSRRSSRTHIASARADGGHLQPFAAKAIPSLDESFVVIHFRGLDQIDFPICWRCCRARLSHTSIR
ncbi:phosphoribulokinase [Serratia marcescens]|uniref:phosphoribulokinase n=1 Tax=Serratia marcescens TaxID=615 RepID=A0A939NQK0_SERMA|nr:phosphoribulokinase [Serratia marcescens]